MADPKKEENKTDNKAPENKGAAAIFGKPPETQINPVTTQPEGVEDRKIEVSEQAMKDLLARMAELEQNQHRQVQASDDVFNPLKEMKDEQTLRASFWGEDIVLGFQSTIRPDGTEVFVNNKVVEDGLFKGQIRGYVTLQISDGKDAKGNQKVKIEEVDYIRFLTELSPVVAKIVKRYDVGKLIEQGEVTKMVWNGRSLVPTATRVMTGSKVQKFEFDVIVNDVTYRVTSDVINLK